MRFSIVLTITVAVVSSAPASTADDFIAPGDNMTLYNIPPVPESLARKVDQYANYRSAGFAEWHPELLEMIVQTRFGDTSQVHRVAGPKAMREQLTFFREPVLGVTDYHLTPQGRDFFTIRMDVGGDEFYQLYRFDDELRERILLTDGEKRHGGGLIAERTGQMMYTKVDADADGAFTEFWVVDPLHPDSDELVATRRGGGWYPMDWSPEATELLVMEYTSVNESDIWVLDVASGEMTHLLPPGADDRRISYRGGQFQTTGEGFYTTSDAFGEFRELMYIKRDSLEHVRLTEAIAWDVEDFDLSPDGRRVAFAVNEGGRSALYLLDTTTEKYAPVTTIPSGVLGGLQWHSDNRHLAFTLTTASIPADVFVLDAPTGVLTRWTYSETGTDTSGFPDAERIEWESFDGRTISGFLYKPPAKFTGKRPVIVNIHGGPEGQSRPRFQGRWNYFLNELGVAIIYPNVRGSAGFGKTFVRLDNGMQREGTYKDIGALLDWIGTRDDLDAGRIMIRGGSYGGHMTLATATRYSDRIACSVNLYGISNLRTFLENTQGYRRDLRRAEYGDERDPEIRAWMDRTAPLNHVNAIRKPMLIQQGVNDPRVPKSESDQIVAALEETGTPVWYLVFDDEGHGFRKKPNADFAFYTVILFAQEYLLK